MDHVSGHRILKKILELEVESNKKTFAKAFLTIIEQKFEYLEKLIKSKGVWVFVCLTEKSGLKNKAKKLFKKYKNKLDQSQIGEKTLLGILNKKEQVSS